MKKTSTFVLSLFVALLSVAVYAAEYPDPAKMAEPVVAPAELNMDAASLDRIDAIIEENIEAGNFPGGVVCIGRGNKIGFLRCYGNRQTEPTVEPVTPDTLYDLASVSKVTSTAIAVAILVVFPDFQDDRARAQPRILHQQHIINDTCCHEGRIECGDFRIITHQVRGIAV